jgi:hypothetical protein
MSLYLIKTTADQPIPFTCAVRLSRGGRQRLLEIAFQVWPELAGLELEVRLLKGDVALSTGGVLLEHPTPPARRNGGMGRRLNQNHHHHNGERHP